MSKQLAAIHKHVIRDMFPEWYSTIRLNRIVATNPLKEGETQTEAGSLTQAQYSDQISPHLLKTHIQISVTRI